TAADHVALELRTELEEALVLLLGAEAHHVLDAGAVVPAAIEDDDLAAGWKLLDVALHEDLRLLAVGGSRQRHDAKDARAHALGDGFDGAALPRAVTTLEHHDDLAPFVLDPFLKSAQLRLELLEILFVLLARELLRLGASVLMHGLSP